MQSAIAVICSVLLVSGIRCEAEPLLSGSNLFKEGHHDYLQSFHHGQHHPSVGSGSEVVGSGSNVGVGSAISEQNSGVTQDQVAHPSVNQVGGHVGQVPVVGPVVPPYIQKSEIPPHYLARAIGSPYPYLYGKTYASPYYAPYQSASPYSGYYPQSYPYQYSASQYSASPYSASPYSVTPYSAGPVYSSPVGGYSGYPSVGGYGYVPPYYQGYSPYYQQSSEVQQTPNKQ